MSWELIKQEEGDDLKIFKVRFDYKKNPRNGKTVKVVVLESQDSVNVVALSKEKKILLVRQHRFGTGTVTVEPPGGLIDPGEQPLTAAIRELREETGCSAKNWINLGSISSNPVFMDNRIVHFLATDVEVTHPKELDDAEDIELVWKSIPEVKRMLKDNEIDHPHAVNALFRFLLWYENQT